MVQARTNLTTQEAARRHRFEPTGIITKTNVQSAIQQVAQASSPVIPTAVAVAQSPYAVQPTDTFIYVDPSGGVVTINLAAAALRNGAPLTVKDITGHAATNKIKIVPNGADTIDGLTELDIVANYGGYRLLPTSTGWAVAP